MMTRTIPLFLFSALTLAVAGCDDATDPVTDRDGDGVVDPEDDDDDNDGLDDSEDNDDDDDDEADDDDDNDGTPDDQETEEAGG